MYLIWPSKPQILSFIINFDQILVLNRLHAITHRHIQTEWKKQNQTKSKENCIYLQKVINTNQFDCKCHKNRMNGEISENEYDVYMWWEKVRNAVCCDPGPLLLVHLLLLLRWYYCCCCCCSNVLLLNFAGLARVSKYIPRWYWFVSMFLLFFSLSVSLRSNACIYYLRYTIELIDTCHILYGIYIKLMRWWIQLHKRQRERENERYPQLYIYMTEIDT